MTWHEYFQWLWLDFQMKLLISIVLIICVIIYTLYSYTRDQRLKKGERK